MPYQPTDDAQLRRTSGRLAGAGAPLLALAVVLYVIGAVLLIVGVTFVGWVCLALATPPAMIAIALLLSAGVGRHASHRRPFA
jgi:hypothetical protein